MAKSEVVQMKNEVAVREDTGPLMSMIERVLVDPSIDVEKLERMIAMQERILDRNAKSAYDFAMSQMQPELPTIRKGGEIWVGNDLRGRFARFEDINEMIRPVLQKHGFNLTFRTRALDKTTIEITAVCAHSGGHREETSLPLGLDTTGSKNAAQAAGSTVSYGKRYTASALLNINAADGDVDDPRDEPQTTKPKTQAPQAKASNKPAAITEKQRNWIVANLAQRGIPETLFLAHFEIGKVDELAPEATRDAKAWIEGYKHPPKEEAKEVEGELVDPAQDIEL